MENEERFGLERREGDMKIFRKKKYKHRWCKIVWGIFLCLVTLLGVIPSTIFLTTYFLNIADPSAKVITYKVMFSQIKPILAGTGMLLAIASGAITCLTLLAFSIEAFQNSKIRMDND